MPKILIAKRISQYGINLLEGNSGFSVEILDEPTESLFLEKLPSADAVLLFFRPLRAHHIAAASNLKFVSRHGVGYDSVDVEGLNARHIPLSITISANVTAVAEHALALLLSVAHRTPSLNRDVRSGLWQVNAGTPMFELANKQALVVGGGRIGLATARRLYGMDMKVLCFDPCLPGDFKFPVGIERTHHLDSALATSDVVSLHIPFNEMNRNLIDPFKMKVGSILINTARGGLIDESKLFAALKENHLAGAGLDVFSQEPVAHDHPFFELDNVVLTPHTAALTDNGLKKMAVESVQNIIDFFNGKLDPQSVVNKVVLDK